MLCRIPFIDLEPIADLLDDDYDYDDYYEYEEEEDEEEKLNLSRREARVRRHIDLGFDPSVELYESGDYCNIIKDMTEHRCLENSLLEIWAGDNYGPDTEAVLASLTQQEIIDKVNNASYSAALGTDQDFSKYLGSVERNSSGHIVRARATFIRFFGQINQTAISAGLGVRGKGSPVDHGTLAWEAQLIQTLTTNLIDTNAGFQFAINVAKR